MTRTLTLALVLALALLASAAHAAGPFDIYKESVLNQVVSKNKLVVGMEVEYWPLEYADKDGQPVGFDVDIARLAAKELGVELEIKDMKWTGLIPALQAGKVDMVISGMTATPTRAKSVTFSEPYFVTGLCVLLSKARAADVKDVDQLNDPKRIIAVKTGTTGDMIASQRFPKATVNRFKDETACAREVATGRADAFIYDQISIAKHQRENSATTLAILKPFTYEPFAIAIRKGDFDFWNWLNMFLSTIKADGRYDELRHRHFAEVLGE